MHGQNCLPSQALMTCQNQPGQMSPFARFQLFRAIFERCPMMPAPMAQTSGLVELLAVAPVRSRPLASPQQQFRTNTQLNYFSSVHRRSTQVSCVVLSFCAIHMASSLPLTAL